MSTDDITPVPIRVHVANAHEIKPAPCGKPGDTEIITQTFVLKTGIRAGGADSLVQRILDRDPSRTRAVILPTANVYLCHTSAQAEAATADSSNAVGVPQDGFIATSAAPLELRTTDPVWAAVSSDKASSGVMVSVISERRRG
ncbi:MAG TPA: hypothetical protein VKU39_11230 [Streptosporangiaceae bacterium]|nr:hypothetical protein [Streptosporangiaceae bacterium]